MSWSVKKEHKVGFSWRCLHQGCRKRTRNCSIRHGSWFTASKKSIRKVLLMTYCWAAGLSSETTIREICFEDGDTMRSKTVDWWFEKCRKVCLHVVQKEKIVAKGSTNVADKSKIDLAEVQWRLHNEGKDSFDQILCDILLLHKPQKRF